MTSTTSKLTLSTPAQYYEKMDKLYSKNPLSPEEIKMRELIYKMEFALYHNHGSIEYQKIETQYTKEIVDKVCQLYEENGWKMSRSGVYLMFAPK